MKSHSAHIAITAFHEAGHVVAALAEGNRVVSVEVSRRQPGSGVAYIIYAQHKNPFDGGQVAPESAWHHALEQQLGVIRSLLAGPLAEAKFIGKPMRSLGSVSDFERCLKKIEDLQPYHDYLRACGGDLAAFCPYEVLNRERMKVRRWLARRRVWACMTYLAEALTQRERLYEKEILWLCAGVPDLANLDQPSLFSGSRATRPYQKPTSAQLKVEQGTAIWLYPKGQRKWPLATWTLPKAVIGRLAK